MSTRLRMLLAALLLLPGAALFSSKTAVAQQQGDTAEVDTAQATEPDPTTEPAPVFREDAAAQPQVPALQEGRADTSEVAPEPLSVGPPPEFSPPPEGRSLRGMVWQPPGELARAERQLREMKRAGVEAVRTRLIREERLLALADSLRLRLFQDLPVAYLPAVRLEELLPTLRWELERALLQARRHPSARHFGLARRSDTSDPATCALLQELSRHVEVYGPAGSRTYYQTSFTEAEKCTDTVDLVLLGALNRDDPGQVLTRWRQVRTEADTASVGQRVERQPVGLGALGTWAAPGLQGLKAPHSPASQARYFERHLPPLLDSTRAGRPPALPRQADDRPADTTRPDSSLVPAVVFVYRWSDLAARDTAAAAPPAESTAFSLQEDPYSRSYGLHDREGQPRPALSVVRGLFTGRQRVFAFRAGTEPPARFPWMILLGWGLVGILGTFYASTPRFRSIVYRYFRAPGFYREAVREGRNMLGSSSFVLLFLTSLGMGMVAAVILLLAQEAAPFMQFLSSLSGPLRGWLLVVLRRPWITVLFVGAFYLLSLSVWAFLLAVISRRSAPLRMEQTLMLVVWPRWPILLLAVGAVVALTLPTGWAPLAAGVLAGGWAFIVVEGSLRTLYDYALLTNLPLVLMPVLILLNPVVIAGVLVFFAGLEFVPEATFLWHLATRS